MFIGFVALDAAISTSLLVRNTSDVPVNADSTPVFRVYGSGAVLTTGSLSQKDTFTVTGATNATPIVITSVAHGLQTGQRVTISGVVGNLGANTTATITRISADTFSLDGVAGTGSYVSGGTGNVSGLYKVSITPTAALGFDVGQSYSVIVTYLVSAVSYAQTFSFTVV